MKEKTLKHWQKDATPLPNITQTKVNKLHITVLVIQQYTFLQPN